MAGDERPRRAARRARGRSHRRRWHRRAAAVVSDAPERDRAAELAALLDEYEHGGFGTVEICLPGRRFVCSFEDLQAVVRRIALGAELSRWSE